MAENQGPLFVQRIIWGALVFSQLIYLGLGLSGAMGPEAPSPEYIESGTPTILFAIGLGQIAFGVFGIPQVIKVSEDAPFAQRQTQRIVQWALIEAGVVLGLVCVISGGPSSVLIGLYVVALVGMLKLFPKDDRSSTSAE